MNRDAKRLFKNMIAYLEIFLMLVYLQNRQTVKMYMLEIFGL